MFKSSSCQAHGVARWLLIIGGLNWGLIGLFQWNLVEVVFGSWEWLVRLIYILVGVATLASFCGKSCKKCA